MQKYFMIISGILSLCAYIPYVYAMIRSGGTVRPNQAGWFVWWLVDAIMVWALYSAGSYNSIPMFAGFTIGSSIVLLLSLRGSERKFSQLDVACVVVAIIGIVVWRVFATTNPAVSVGANMLALTMGAIPTIKKALLDPKSESALTWRIFLAGGTFSMLAIPAFTFVDVGPALITFLIQFAINLALLIGTFLRHVLQYGMKKAEMSRRSKV